MSKKLSEKFFVDYIDEVYGKAQALDAEHLAVPLDTYEITYEITINFPSKTLSTAEHVECYKNLWAQLTVHYETNDALYFIEYCKSGHPHLHGYMRVKYPAASLKYDDSHFLRDVALQIFLKLPRNFRKQYTNKLVYNAHFRRVVSPAVCINMKNYLSTNWLEYIRKNAFKQ